MQILRAAYRAGGTSGDEPPPIAQFREAADRIFAARPPVLSDLFEVANLVSAAAMQLGDREMMVPYIRQVFALTEGTTDSLMIRQRDYLRPLYALYVEGDEGKAIELKKQSMDAGWEEDASGLNSYAWWCFQHRLDLANAEQLARKGVDLAEDPSRRANILDTVAELVNARGDRQGAVALIQQAVELNPESEYLQAQLARFTAE
jgi:tetratricopeptide (TPR) repeat protein